MTERARSWLAQWGPMLPLLVAEATIWVGFGALLPILVLAFVAPFVAGPERLTRVLRGRGEPPRPIVNVTPHPPTSLPPGTPTDDDAAAGPDDVDGGR